MGSVVFYILYVLIMFIANVNVFLKCLKIDILNNYIKIILIFFGLIFALEMMVVFDFMHDMVYASLMLICFSSLIFVFLSCLVYLKKKDVYEGSLALIIDIWEFITFVPIFIFGIWSFSFGINFDVDYILVALVSFALFYLSVISAIRPPKIKHINITSHKIKTPLKIAMISDIHLKKNINKDFFKSIVDNVNSLNADCVVIVGDLIDTNIKYVKDLELLNDFSSKYGTFYTLGNHEYYHNVSQIYEKLSQYKINILDNKSKIFDEFVLFGVNDLMGLKMKVFEPDIMAVKKDIDKNKLNILLTHQPKFVKKYDVSDFDLVLAGHTHAGQVFLFSLIVKLEQGFLHGLYKIGKNTLMYVSSGAGFWGASARILAPSEIVLIDINPEKL